MLAEELHVPAVTLESLLQGNTGEGFRAEISRSLRSVDGPVLVIDDTGYHGRTMKAVRERLKPGLDVRCGAVYATDESMKVLDIRGYRLTDIWHVFEHSLLRDYSARYTVSDLDGVIAVNYKEPAEEGPVYGPRYAEFLSNAKPLRIPTKPLLGIVTARLEKYRKQTETWLRGHSVPYNTLYMANYATSKDRHEARGFAGPKAKHYMTLHQSDGARLFVESDHRQAEEIASITKLPVLCFETQTMWNGREVEPTF